MLDHPVGPKSNDKCPYKKDTQKKSEEEDRGRDGVRQPGGSCACGAQELEEAGRTHPWGSL